jgi:hypothetical protein
MRAARRRAVGSLIVALGMGLPLLSHGQTITIEKATIPWSELERLMRREGQVPNAVRGAAANAPAGWSLSADVAGEISEGRARMTVRAEISVLEDRWTVVPLIPASWAVSSARVDAPNGRRGLLVRAFDGVAFAADGADRYPIVFEVEAPLESTARGNRLSWSPPGLTGGEVRLDISSKGRVGGKTSWRTEIVRGSTLARAALSASGFDLVVSNDEMRAEVGTMLEELRATTVISLGGGGVTRLVVNVVAADGEISIALPSGARFWKGHFGREPLKASAIQAGVLKVTGRGNLELAYTFDGSAMGLRGRWSVDLPRFPVTIRDARWEIWLPSGLAYRETQSSLATSGCVEPSARKPLETQGICHGFSRGVLESSRAYAEGVYEQAL